MSTAPARPRRTRLHHDERREQILKAAGRLFSERPYGAVSTVDIAREAGVARGLLHHYFGSKRDLYLEVLRMVLKSQPRPALPDPDADPEAVVNGLISGMLKVMERQRPAWLAIVSGVNDHSLTGDPEIRAALEAGGLDYYRVYLSLFHPGDPENAPPELFAAVSGWAAMAIQATRQWLKTPVLTAEQLQVLLVQSLLAIVRDVVPQMTALSAEEERAASPSQATTI